MKILSCSALFLAALIALAACVDSPVPDPKATSGRNPLVAEQPSADETVRGEDDPPIVTLELGSALHERRLSAGDDLPGNIMIPTTNLNAVPITAALQAVLAGTDISLSWDTGALGNNLVTVMNLSGPLPRVVERICASAKVFCSYRHGSLELAEKDTFVVPLPPISKAVTTSSTTGSGNNAATASGSANSMVEAISQLVGSKVQVDDQAGNIIYTADVNSQERVSRYLDQLRNGRPLIVLQLYVWEVTLTKENGEGINWSEMNLSKIGPGAAKLALAGTSAFTSLANTSGSVSLGAITTGHLNTNSLISFLSTQGRVQTISNPQVTFVSGSGAELKVGGKLRYISQVGQLVAATNTSGTNNASANTGVGTNTVSTDSIDTGLNISVAGSYENNVVFANLELSLTNLVSLNPTNSGSGTIDLPQTSDEKINTVIRVRPGDNLVMAGLVTSSDNNQRQGIPLGSDSRIPTYGDDQMQNRELVIVVKPSVVLFSDSMAKADAKKKEEAKPLPDAMLIDRDGAKPFAVTPSSGSLGKISASAVSGGGTPAPQPELMVPAGDQAMAQPTPLVLGGGNDGGTNGGAEVDRRMMQRGFSHAFDQLLQPSSSNLSAYGGSPPSFGEARP